MTPHEQKKYRSRSTPQRSTIPASFCRPSSFRRLPHCGGLRPAARSCRHVPITPVLQQLGIGEPRQPGPLPARCTTQFSQCPQFFRECAARRSSGAALRELARRVRDLAQRSSQNAGVRCAAAQSPCCSRRSQSSAATGSCRRPPAAAERAELSIIATRAIRADTWRLRATCTQPWRRASAWQHGASEPAYNSGAWRKIESDAQVRDAQGRCVCADRPGVRRQPRMDRKRARCRARIFQTGLRCRDRARGLTGGRTVPIRRPARPFPTKRSYNAGIESASYVAWHAVIRIFK